MVAVKRPLSVKVELEHSMQKWCSQVMIAIVLDKPESGNERTSFMSLEERKIVLKNGTSRVGTSLDRCSLMSRMGLRSGQEE